MSWSHVSQRTFNLQKVKAHSPGKRVWANILEQDTQDTKGITNNCNISRQKTVANHPVQRGMTWSADQGYFVLLTACSFER